MQKRIYLIDYLKALCIIMVIFTHYDWKDKTTPFFTLIIAMAVPIFMIISGFNFTMSYDKKSAHTLRQLYEPSLILHRLYRFLLPFFILYILEMLLHGPIRKEYYSPSSWLLHFIEGGLGPGSYYVPVLIVMLFTFPLIYLAVKRFSYLGVCLVAVINLAYEIFVVYAAMSNYLYRLLFFRYLLYVALGCYMYFHFKDKKTYPLPTAALLLMFLVGLSFSVSVYQLGYRPVIFKFWTKTAMPVALYIFPIVYYFMNRLGQVRLPSPFHLLFSEIGQASYHIFLVQMVYYRLFDHLIFPPKPAIPVVCGNIIISLALGYGYYLLESRLSGWILKKLQK